MSLLNAREVVAAKLQQIFTILILFGTYRCLHFWHESTRKICNRAHDIHCHRALWVEQFYRILISFFEFCDEVHFFLGIFSMYDV